NASSLLRKGRGGYGRRLPKACRRSPATSLLVGSRSRFVRALGPKAKYQPMQKTGTVSTSAASRCRLLDSGRKQSLEMRAFLLARNDGDFDFFETGGFEPLMQLHFAKA